MRLRQDSYPAHDGATSHERVTLTPRHIAYRRPHPFVRAPTRAAVEHVTRVACQPA